MTTVQSDFSQTNLAGPPSAGSSTTNGGTSVSSSSPATMPNFSQPVSSTQSSGGQDSSSSQGGSTSFSLGSPPPATNPPPTDAQLAYAISQINQYFIDNPGKQDEVATDSQEELAALAALISSSENVAVPTTAQTLNNVVNGQINHGTSSLLNAVVDEDEEHPTQNQIADARNELDEYWSTNLSSFSITRTDVISAASSLSGTEGASIGMGAMMMAVETMSINNLTTTTNIVAKALQIMSDDQAALNNHKVQVLKQECDAAVEKAQKAHKSGFFGMIASWVTSIVDVIVGVVQVVVGAITLNPQMIASGVAFCVAGAAGFVAAVAQTIAACDPDNQSLANVCNKIAQIAGYIQMGAEVIGALINPAVGMVAAGINGAVRGATQIAKGALELEAAKLQKLIEQLVALLTLLSSMVAQQQQMIAEDQQLLKNLMNDQSIILNNTTNYLASNAALQVKIAGSLNG